MELLAEPRVRVFTAGDHFGGAQEPAQTSELLELLLKRSGYTKGYEWECRVDKLRHCSAESRPVRMVGFKPYGVSVRVKPDVHATRDYEMTLLIPQGSGYSAKSLFTQLKANEKSISRTIRQEQKEKKEVPTTTMTTVIERPHINGVSVTRLEIKEEEKKEVVEPETFVKDERPEFANLQGVVKSHDKLLYVLKKVKSVIDTNFCKNRVQFAQTLKHECHWRGSHLAAVSRVLTELVKSEYLMERVNERDKVIGYLLTDKGRGFLEKYKDAPPPPSAPPTPPKPKINIPDMLIGLKDKLQELADVARRIAANNAERASLEQKIELLDKENEELSKVFNQNKEAQEVLVKLGQFINPLPLQGVRPNDSPATSSV